MRARLKNTAKWMATIAMAAMLMFCLAACASGQEASSDWVEGHRFSQITTAEDVSQWLESL